MIILLHVCQTTDSKALEAANPQNQSHKAKSPPEPLALIQWITQAARDGRTGPMPERLAVPEHPSPAAQFVSRWAQLPGARER